MSGPDQIISTPNLITSDPDGAVKIPDTCLQDAISVPSVFKDICSKYMERVSLAVKRNDEWLKWTYDRLYQDVNKVAKGFIKLGLQKHFGVGIMGFNSPEWTMAKLGAIQAGGIGVGIYATNGVDTCRYIVSHSRVQILVVEDERQVDKIKTLLEDSPLKVIIQYTGTPTTDGVLSWNDLMELGAQESDTEMIQRHKNMAINECCGILYTSGTTGNPKGVMMSHFNYVQVAKRTANQTGIPDNCKFVSFLPLSHSAAQTFDLWIPLFVGGSVHFADKSALKGTLVQTLKEVKPNFFIGVPRVWEKIYDQVRQGMAAMKAKGVAPQLGSNPGDMVKAMLGFDQTIIWANGGAPLSLDIFDFFNHLGILIWDGYGMSETCGPHVTPSLTRHKRGTVGFGVGEVKIGHQNEILMRGPNCTMGYLYDKSKTQEIIDEEGWIHSGDIGSMDEEGFVTITGRLKDIIITAGGENVPPIPIEESVKAQLPIISNAMVIGDAKKFVSILLTLKVNPDPNTMMPTDKLNPDVLKFLQSLGLSQELTKVSDVSTEEAFLNAIQNGLNLVNEKSISNVHKIKKFIILPMDFSIQGGEFGPTMKLKRHAVLKKYCQEIENLYHDKE